MTKVPIQIQNDIPKWYLTSVIKILKALRDKPMMYVKMVIRCLKLSFRYLICPDL